MTKKRRPSRSELERQLRAAKRALAKARRPKRLKPKPKPRKRAPKPKPRKRQAPKSKSALKGWRTRRANQRKRSEAAARGWQTRKAKPKPKPKPKPKKPRLLAREVAAFERRVRSFRKRGEVSRVIDRSSRLGQVVTAKLPATFVSSHRTSQYHAVRMVIASDKDIAKALQIIERKYKPPPGSTNRINASLALILPGAATSAHAARYLPRTLRAGAREEIIFVSTTRSSDTASLLASIDAAMRRQLGFARTFLMFEEIHIETEWDA